MEPLYRDGELEIAWDPPDAPAVAFDTPDVSNVPGARIVAATARADAGVRVGAGCLRGPSGRFVPGLETVLFDKATWFMLRAADARPTEMAITATSGAIEDGLVTQDRTGVLDTQDRIAIRGLLTFVGEERDAVLCAVVCVTGPDVPCPVGATARERGDDATPITSLHAAGPHASPPEPAAWMKAIFWGAEHPREAGAVLAILFLVVASALVVSRPRRRALD